MKHPVLVTAASALLLLARTAPANSADTQERNVDGIRDNSFLVEEAYNQEAGVVQHILTGLYQVDRRAGPDDKTFDFTFTQEWPVFSQTHQFSYTVPYSFADSGSESSDGIGDVMLNYRFEAYFEERSLTAFAPRFSLILPTGDEEKGFGEDTVGYQANLPFSTTLGDHWFTHLNAGATFLPDAASANGRDLWNYNLGASVIYAATRNFHLMLEWVGNWDETLRASGGSKHEFSSVIMPGARKAFNFASGLQIVAGAGVPVGLTGSTPEIGAFLYVSFEHAFRKQD